jgi:hypothetical protein
MLGLLLAGMVLTIRLGADWGRLGDIVARNPELCWGIAVGLMLWGAWLVKRSSQIVADWRPQRPGQRFHTAVLYTREDCALCDEAARTLKAYQTYLPQVRTVDIDRDATLRKRFATCVPVFELDGRVRFRGHISETLLRRLIDGTAPLAIDRS